MLLSFAQNKTPRCAIRHAVPPYSEMPVLLTAHLLLTTSRALW